MKEIVIHSFEELQEVIFADCYDENLGRYRNNRVYRGVCDKDYFLCSKLNRICGHNLSLEQSILRSFKKYGFADIKEFTSVWQLLAMGQHYGLPTRLLDWSYSPLVAAHFATEDIYMYDRDGVIYSLDLNEAKADLPDDLRKELDTSGSHVFTIAMLERHFKTLDELNNYSEKPFYLFYEPASQSDRMANQYALFSVCSDTSANFAELLQETCSNSLYRIIIPKEIKLEIRDKLDYINISERMIYPGLDGICRWITRHYADLGTNTGKWSK
ncbi:MAG: FRG domain-containing protein [Erysipelotrichaceae bacterium]|nr:FRG domain-containing protein [Erysipelotrichaceae bacterium]